VSNTATASTLDELFGVPRLPCEVRAWEFNAQPQSLQLLDEALGQTLNEWKRISANALLLNASKCAHFIWCIDEQGATWIAYEEIARPQDGDAAGFKQAPLFKEGLPRFRDIPVHPALNRKLGHPTLISGQKARIAGELYLDPQYGGNIEWVANARSGRYCNPQPSNNNCINARNHLRSLIDQNLIWDFWI